MQWLQGKPSETSKCLAVINVLQSQSVQREVADDLQERLTAAEQALVAKQNAIDHMKQELYSKEKDLETISVFQAQVRRSSAADEFYLMLSG